MKNLLQFLRKKINKKKTKENVRNVSGKLEEKTENMRLNSVNSRKTSLGWL